jgi:hypothetical protein
MQYCAPQGIPHSQFLAWAAEDRDKALWWLIHDRQTCKQCGTRPDEWDPDLGGSKDAYRWRVEPKCPGCAVLEVGEKRRDMAKDGRYPKDAHVVLVPNVRE